MSGFVNTGTVVSLEIKYNVQEKWMKRPTDVQMIIEYSSDNPAVTWNKRMKINGSFNKEKDHWGSALKTKMFFEACGIKNPEYKEDYTFPDNYVDQCMGKQFLVLAYPSVKLKDNGKNWWNDWAEVAPTWKGIDHLKERFAKAVKDGYVKDFQPKDALNEPTNVGSSNTVNTSFGELDI